MISNNYVPEVISNANIYLDGNKMVGAAAEIELPNIKLKANTINGMGIGGDIDSPTIGQFESLEQKINFNTLYSSAMPMMRPDETLALTIRAAQQAYVKTGGVAQKGLRVVERGRVKEFVPGKVKPANSMEASVTIELTYILIEVDGETLTEIDKLNDVYIANGKDMLADIRPLI